MAAKIGRIIYLLGCAISTLAVIALAIVIWYLADAADTTRWGEILVFKLSALSVASWLIGRVARYILERR